MHQSVILNEVLEKIPESKTQWEIYFLGKEVICVEGKDLNIDKQKKAYSERFFIRVLKEKKVGYSYCVHKDQIKKAFETAIDLAEISDSDEFLSLPEPKQPQQVEVYDKDLVESIDRVSQFLISMQEAAFFDRRIKKLRNAQLTVEISQQGVLNSNGLALFQPFTTVTAHIVAVAEDIDSQMAWSYRAERFIKNIDFEEIGREASRKALSLLNPKKINSFRGMVLFDPSVSVEFLELIAQSLSAENYQMGKSLFIDKMGKVVISEDLSLIDDALIPQKFGSKPFDAEGVPTSKKILIENGILTLLMHNTYTANRAKTISTGNAIRTERGISVGPTNLYIESKKKYSQKDLINMIDKGLYVLEVMGMHTANPISGEFSVGISGIYIKNGQPIHPVKEVVISGNVLDLFRRVAAVGDDLMFFGNIGSPSLLVEGIDISG